MAESQNVLFVGGPWHGMTRSVGSTPPLRITGRRESYGGMFVYFLARVFDGKRDRTITLYEFEVGNGAAFCRGEYPELTVAPE